MVSEVLRYKHSHKQTDRHPVTLLQGLHSVQEEKLELRRKEMREQKEKREARKRRIEQVLSIFFICFYSWNKTYSS